MAASKPEDRDDGAETENTRAHEKGQLPCDGDLSILHTVDEAVEKMGFGAFQILLSMFAGSIWLVDAFEVMILSILSAAVKCEWNLSSVQEATITTVVFLGFLLGNPVWGVVADKFGRKKALMVALSWGFVFSIVSAFSPGYYTLLLFRGMVGVGFSGGFLGPAYCIEFLPAKSRAVILCLLEVAWAIGSMLEALLAVLVMTSIDHEPWRWLLGLSALPLFVVILTFPIVPESPRYLIFCGQEEKAMKVLALMAKINCKPMLSGRLVTVEEKRRLTMLNAQQYSLSNGVQLPGNVSDETRIRNMMEENGYEILQSEAESDDITCVDHEVSLDNASSDIELLTVSSNEHTQWRTFSWAYIRKIAKRKAINYYHWSLLLFKNGYWRTTLLLWYLWMSASLIYYGGVLLTTSIFQHDEHCALKNGNATTQGCKPLSKSDYIHLVWTTCAEFPGTIWIIVLLLVIGRKKSMALTTAAAAVCYGLLFLCLGKTVLTVFLFGVRGFATGFMQSNYLYTPEVYPTSVRAFAMSLCAGFGRIGSITAPYIAQTLVAYDTIATISVFAVISMMASLAALLLPIETRGRAMEDTGG